MNIDNELIEKIIRDNIENQLKGFDYKEIIRDYVRNIASVEIRELCKKHIQSIIESEIQKVMLGEIDTDNGWGERHHYNSFEDLFKEVFHKKLNENWEIKRVIETTVNQRIDELIKKKTKEMTNKIQDMLLGELEQGE